HAVHPIAALQTEYSLWTRDVEDGILPLLRELGIGLVAYSPLGRGFLTGAIKELPENDNRNRYPRFSGEALKKNLSLVETLQALAAKRGATAAQLALAWILHRDPNYVPIPGTTKLHRLEENLGAAEIQLSAADLAAIEAAVPETAVEGERYPEFGMAMVNL
ncbi:MAG: aldo/keto reductase, partial [Phenylobacterium sp.]